MKKRKISFQKTFNVISFLFILGCCLFYGGRFVKLYLDNKEQVVIEADTLGKKLRESNESLLKNINGEYYFNGQVDTNYVLYSGILFRVIKIGENNIITMISDNSVTSLAYGENVNYFDSYVNIWLNKSTKNNSGILEKNFNSISTYLKKISVCSQSIDDISNTSCEDVNDNYYLTTLSISDYINTGAGNGFINNGEYFYLNNFTSNNEAWYVNNDGKIDKSDGTSIYGVKVVITLKENMNLVSGTGTKDDPYVIENNFGLFGSYVKLGDDTWRVIDVNDNNLKLMLDDYIHDGTDVISYKYSNYSFYHDDTRYGTLAYYMNKDYLNKLDYKDIIIESDYANGYYGSENKFDYTGTLDTKINTKVALVSVGDVILNHDLNNYFTLTSSSKKNNFLYTVQSDNVLYSKIMSSTLHVVPVITISKDSLEGTGSKSEPLRLVNVNE